MRAADARYWRPAAHESSQTQSLAPKGDAVVQTRIVTVVNQKGGVGKTTTTVNMAAALSQQGTSVLVVDTDPQGNASTAFDIAHDPGVLGTYEVLVDSVPLAEVVQPAPQLPGVTVVPATRDLAGAEVELVSAVARERKLARALKSYLNSLAERPAVVLIDCPPSLGLLTLNALVAADEVLIPIQCEYYALEGVGQLVETLRLVQEELNPQLHIGGILLTMFDGRTRLSQQVADEVRQHFPAEVYETKIPRSVRVSEAPSHGQSVLTYDPLSVGAQTYRDVATEFLQRLSMDSEDNKDSEVGQ